MQSSILARPQGLYFEDLSIGHSWVSPGLTVTEEAIIGFAFTWDPQPFHVDKVASTGSVFGGLVASGLQTLMLSYRLYYDLGLLRDTALAGLGMDEVRFLSPLRPGDTITVKVTVLDIRPTSKPDRGVVKMGIQTLDQNDRQLLSFTLIPLVARRRAASS